MSITTASGARLYIGSTNRVNQGSPLFQYSEDDWLEVGEIEDLGEFGDESPAVTFSSLSDSRTRKLKGARDAGTMALVVGRDPLNAGQARMKAAEQTKFEYNFKVVAADAPSELYSDSVYYFSGLVMSARDNYGQNDNVVRSTFNIGINSAITEEIAALL